MEHGHEVEQLAATERILDQMVFRPGPKDHRILAEALGHILDWQYGTVGDMAGHAWPAVPDQVLADL